MEGNLLEMPFRGMNFHVVIILGYLLVHPEPCGGAGEDGEKHKDDHARHGGDLQNVFLFRRDPHKKPAPLRGNWLSVFGIADPLALRRRIALVLLLTISII